MSWNTCNYSIIFNIFSHYSICPNKNIISYFDFTNNF